MTREPKARPITATQVRAIRARQRMSGMPDETYRSILRARHGVESTLDLTVGQASELMNWIYGRPARPRRTRRAERSERRPVRDARAPNVATLATAEQRRVIEEMVAEIRWRESDGYRRWISRQFGLRGEPRTTEEASAVIRGLIGMRRHQDRRGRGGEDGNP